MPVSDIQITPPTALPSEMVFTGGIKHPELWLWDSWTVAKDASLYLYCLALNREDRTGQPILPSERNEHTFHIRCFKSKDQGSSWKDLGVLLEPSPSSTYYDRNVWSGGAIRLSDGRILFGFTGIRHVNDDIPFQQSIGIALTDGQRILSVQADPISCPIRDFQKIIDKGYYLGERQALGHKDGEDGGPIMAWRDPYFIETPRGLEVIWSAKFSPQEGCVAHALLGENDSGFFIQELFEPIRLPEKEIVTQTEVPKIYGHEGNYLLLISACNRLFEGQKDSEVNKMLRLYKSANITGPWVPFHPNGSALTMNDELFGASILDYKTENGHVTFVAPITEMSTEANQLTISPRLTANINSKVKKYLKL